MTDCSICLEEFKKDDKFHYNCIINNNCCPLCRTNITSEELCKGNHNINTFLKYQSLFSVIL